MTPTEQFPDGSPADTPPLTEPLRYVVITPVRNEGDHFQRTVDSMTAQTMAAAEWIIVDDGSTDETPRISADAAAAHPWIRVVNRSDRGHRKSGVGVVEAFYDGFGQLSVTDWDLVVKLDGDLEFAPDYFEALIEEFLSDGRLGVAGGDVFHYVGDRELIESENDPVFHVRGAAKAYRRACWDAMGGLISVTGWDTLDEVKASQLDWTTRRIPELKLLHLKPTGAVDGAWRNALKNGRGSYICGYHPLYVVARAARKFRENPGLVEPSGILAGFLRSYFDGTQRISDKGLVRYLRQQQFRRLTGRPSVWR